MGQASVTLNGRVYSLSCGEGEEARLQELAAVVRAKLDGLVAEYGKAGDDRLLLMSALMIADELLDARARIAALENATATAT
jgi:cell division protein ZapA